MKTLTKIIVASTAGILSAGLATAGAFAATGAFSVQDQAGTAISAHGVTGAVKHVAQSAATTAEQKAAALRGEVSKAADQAASQVPALPTTIPSVPSVPGVAAGSGTASGSVSGTAGSVTGSGTAGATGTAGTSGVSATGNAAATVVAPPAAVDVRSNGSVTLSH